MYLTLSAQYESFVLPFIVLLAVPMALLGALGAQWMRGLQNDVFCQVGLVMLVGLSSKNAILIVEFAEQLRQRGMPLVEAAVQAATIRLRPILMTSLAFILGVVPLVLATGAGENGRHSVGTTVFGGMIMSTFLNLFFIPVLYLIIEGWREHGKKAAAERVCVVGFPRFCATPTGLLLSARLSRHRRAGLSCSAAIAAESTRPSGTAYLAGLP